MRGKYTSAMADGKFQLTSLGSEVLQKQHRPSAQSNAQMLHANTDIESIMAQSLDKPKVRAPSG